MSAGSPSSGKAPAPPGGPDALVDSLPDALVVFADDGQVSVANEGAARLWGAPRAELIGLAIDELLAPGELERLRTLERQRNEGWDLPQTFRMRLLRRPDRSEVHADVCFSHVADRMLLSLRDATASRNAGELMARLADLSAQSGGMLSLDALLDEASPIFAALGWVVTFTEVQGSSATVRRVVGGPASNPVKDYGLTLLGRTVPLDRYPVVQAVVSSGRPLFMDNLPALQTGPVKSAVALSRSMELARGLNRTAWLPVPHEGGLHVLAVAGSCLTADDHVAIRLFAAQMATALRLEKLRAELVRRERLAAVGQMAAVLAHEVRNPLAVVFNTIGVMQRYAERPEERSLLGILSEEADRLQRLVSELLDFARPAGGTPQPVALPDLVREALQAAVQDPGCVGREYCLEVVLPEGLPWGWADPHELRRALVNVMVNAFQNVSPGGTVRVSASRAEERLRVRVFDDGPSIPAETAARVFEPFFTTRASGTGLGLAVVKQVMEGLGGRVDLEQDGQGVCFSLLIPLAPAVAHRAG
ncbi:MAG: PAS domain-containing protein [Deltaproteobacteria bacterium]|nr:PAS domain-containing protein [Deltaproteobacteria bacterium]